MLRRGDPPKPKWSRKTNTFVCCASHLLHRRGISFDCCNHPLYHDYILDLDLYRRRDLLVLPAHGCYR